MATASVVSLEQREKNHDLELEDDLEFFLLMEGSIVRILDLESSRMFRTPSRLPSVMLLSWKNDPVDYNNKRLNHKHFDLKCNRNILSNIHKTRLMPFVPHSRYPQCNKNFSSRYAF